MAYSAVKAAALAAGLAFLAAAPPASAAFLIHLNSASMDTSYTANINVGSIHETGISNGVTFNVTNLDAPHETYDLFAFCIDVFHNMTLGGLDDIYQSTYGTDTDPLTSDFGAPPVDLTSDQRHSISALVDIGYILHRDHPGSADASLRTAAIQAAIWDIEHPGSVTLNNGGASAGGAGTYQSYFDDYKAVTGPGSRIFTITDVNAAHDPKHQTFAVGWPPEGGVPEPSAWALMLAGFGGMGAVLRRRRAVASA